MRRTPTSVTVLSILGLIFGGFTIFVYAVLWIFVPRENV